MKNSGMKIVPLDQIRAQLASEGFRWTAPREQVLSVLAAHAEPLTAKDVLAGLLTRVNLASIYRTLELFVEKNIAVEVDSVEEGRRYELSDRYRAHHHHLICRSCGDVRDVEGCLLDRVIQEVAVKMKFRVLSHEVRLVGVCDRCGA